MLANLFKPIMLWVSGGVVTAGLAGYAIIDSYQETRSKPEVVAEQEMPKVEKPAEVASLPKKEIETKPTEQTPAASTPEAAPEHPLPKFDILRVEKDGYAVIAGSAPAGSKVEIFDGDTIIATEKAGSTNEFVVVLDKPLMPGPHDLVIQATLDGGKKLISAEAGIVNIPDGKNELLAMVTEPGKASRILQKPEPKKEAPKQEAAKEVVTEAKEEAKEQVQKELPKEEPKEVVAETPKAEKEVAVEMAEKSEPAVETKPSATPAPEKAEEASKAETQIASLEQKPKEQPAAKPETEVEEKTTETPAIAEQPKQVVNAEEPKQIAKVEEPAKSQVPVLIQAAEVEGEKIFIAGTGQSGTSVHIYIDGNFLGKAEVGAEGSYVFEGKGGLAAGRHAVRADMVADESTDVIARAVVSLLHEPDVTEPVKAANVEPTPKVSEPAKDVAKMAEAKTPESMPKTIVEKTTEAASESVKLAMKPTEKVVKAEKKEMAVAAAEPAKQEPMKVATAEEKVEMSSNAEPAATPKKMEKPATDTASDATASVAEITTGSSVIIRKGDSLWRVSQRRYGRGVRYTTIFDANRDQIRDPNLIYPGQVLEIPEFKEKS